MPVRKEFPERLFLLCAMGPAKNRSLVEEHGIPVLEDPSHAIEAIAAVTAIGRGFKDGIRPKPITKCTSTIFPGPINETDAKKTLASIGILSPMEILATTRDDAIAAAQTIAGSVALKIVSADI